MQLLVCHQVAKVLWHLNGDLLDCQKNDFLLVSIMGVELAIEHGLKEATRTELVAGVLLLTALK